MADADLGRAAEAAYAGAFWSAGQKCTATRRIYVQDGAYDAFRDAFLARVESGKVGDPADPDTEVGPLVNESAMEDVLGAIERGRSRAAPCSPAARAATTTRSSWRRPCSRTSPTTPRSPARRCSAR